MNIFLSYFLNVAVLVVVVELFKNHFVFDVLSNSHSFNVIIIRKGAFSFNNSIIVIMSLSYNFLQILISLCWHVV